MKEWHCVLSGQPQGPFGEEQLREMARRGEIALDTLVWSPLSENAASGWVRAGETELAALFAGSFTPPRGAAPVVQIPGALFAPFLSPSVQLAVHPQTGEAQAAVSAPEPLPAPAPEPASAPVVEPLSSQPEPQQAVESPDTTFEPTAAPVPVQAPEPEAAPVVEPVPEPEPVPIIEPSSQPAQEMPFPGADIVRPQEDAVLPEVGGRTLCAPTTPPGDVAAPVEPLRALLLSQLAQLEQNPAPVSEAAVRMEAPMVSEPAPVAPAEATPSPVPPVAEPVEPQGARPETPDAPQAPVLAARETRLAAFMINLAALSALILVYLALPALRFFKLEIVAIAAGVVLALMVLAFAGCNLYFLNRDGQSLGKKAMRVRIADREGFPVPLWKIAALRWSLCYVGLIALYLNVWLGAAVFLVDAGFAFRKDQRALHDLIAGTTVVKE